MSVTINFSSPPNPPHNIASFNIERSIRPASGSIGVVGDVNNVTKVVTVTFTGTPPADNALAGDQMHIGGLLYNIIGNDSTTITFSSSTDLSTIVTFPASFDIINDLAEFSTFELIGSVSPDIPFKENAVHQFTDSTGTIFDFYRIKTVDSGGTISASALTAPFRPGQVVALSIDEDRRDPQDTLLGLIGGSVSFEITSLVGGRRQDPKNNEVFAKVYAPPTITPNGRLTEIAELEMARVGLGRYRVTWNIPLKAPSAVGGFSLFPSDDYIVSYVGNYFGIVNGAVDDLKEFASEFVTLHVIDGPVGGRFPPYATVADLRQTLFEIDAYLPESIKKSDLERRDAILFRHLEWASDKLREELNIHQLRANSSDRNEYVCSRAIYTLLMAARGQNSSAISMEFLEEWRERAKYVLEQLKREGIAQGMPLGRG